MYWLNSTPLITLGFIGLLMGCLSSDEITDFHTDLISLSMVVDSVFDSGDIDSISTVSKTIWVNQGSPETKTLDNYNIRSDLLQLKDYDVATPRWAGFIVTNSRDSSGFDVITYTTENERAPIRYITFVKSGNTIQSLDVNSQKNTFISNQKTRIQWDLNKGYTLETSSHLLFRNPSEFRMRVNYK